MSWEEEEELPPPFLRCPRPRIPRIDLVLGKRGLRRVSWYSYNAGDCLFDSVAYILGDEEKFSSALLRRNMVNFFRLQLKQGQPKAVEWKDNFLVADNLQELHPELRGIERPEVEYYRRMRLSVSHGGLWGDHFCVFWLQEMLCRPIKVWLGETCKLLGGDDSDDEESEGDEDDIHIVYHGMYGVAHYEPAVYVYESSSEDEIDDDTLFESSPDLTVDEDDQAMGSRLWLHEDDPELQVLKVEEPKLAPLDEVCGRPEFIEVEEIISNKCFFDEEEDSPPTLKRWSSPEAEGSYSCKRLRRDPSEEPVLSAGEESETDEKALDSPGTQEPPQSTTTTRTSSSPESTGSTSAGSTNLEILEDDCAALTNFEVFDFLLDRAASSRMTKVESLVYGYLSETPAAQQSAEQLIELDQDTLLARLSPQERVQVINTRADHPMQLGLIVQNLDRRFSEEEVQSMAQTINKTLPGQSQPPNPEAV